MASTLWTSGVANGTPPISSSTASPSTTSPLIGTRMAGVASLVVSSLSEVPLSDAATKSGVPPVGSSVSRVSESAAVVLSLPAVSDSLAVIDFVPSAPRSPSVTVNST